MRTSSAVILALAAAMALAGPAAAQQSEPNRYHGSGYAIYGMGACQHGVMNVSFGVGGEGFVWRGLTLGGDAGYYRFVERGGSPIGVATVNVGYNFADRKRPGRFDPFVNVGLVGLAFTTGAATPAGADRKSVV